MGWSVNLVGRGGLPKYAGKLFEHIRYKVLYGGRGGARSWSVARTLLIRAWKQPTRVLCVREFQNSIRDSVHQLLRDQIKLLGLPGFTVTEREIRHANGSLFVFWGLRRNPEKIKSFEGADVVWCEEAERIPKVSWLILLPTIRKPGSEVWVTFNPDLEGDYTYQYWVLHPPRGAWVQRVYWWDNPWLPNESRLEQQHLARTDPEAERWVWGGECRRSTEALVLHGKWVIDAVDVPVDEHGNLGAGWNGPYFGMDFGFAQDPFGLVKLYTFEDELHVQDEVYRLGLELNDIADTCERAIPGCTRYVVRADSARPDSISYLKQPRPEERDGTTHFHFPRIVPATKGAGSIEDGILHLRSYRRIVVNPRCRNWIREAQSYSYKVDERSGEVLPIIVDANNNLMDPSRYALEPVMKRKAKPLAGSREHITKRVKPLALGVS